MQSSDTSDEYLKVLTQTVRTVPAKNLSLPYVSYMKNIFGEIDSYSVPEIINDFCTYPGPFEALVALFEKSDCPMVQKFREALAESFCYHCAGDVEMMKEVAL